MSLDKSKVTVEDSAKSAAKFAGEAMEKTADKVKTTLLSRGRGYPRLAFPIPGWALRYLMLSYQHIGRVEIID